MNTLRHAEPVMGTVVSFDIRDPGPGTEAALVSAVAWLHRVDRVFSTYRPDSQISRLGRGEAELADCDPEVAEVLALGERAERDGDGWFSVRPDGSALDPSGVVKGWAVERASAILRAAGSLRHSVNGGGDVQTCGEPEPGRGWNLAVAHPLRPGAFAAVVRGSGIALATSGTAERGAHILDPHTGSPVGGGLAAFAMGGVLGGAAARRWLERAPGLEGFAVTADGRAWWTPGFGDYAQLPGTG
jgi:thiamine biosynthesis lipoprotein